VFESILAPIEQVVDMLPNYFDPRVAPEAMLPWLASWVGAELDENWPATRGRALIQSLASLYRMRGTRRGLRTHLQLYTGKEPLIVESFDGLRVGQDARLGATAQFGVFRPHWLFITVYATTVEEVDEQIIRQIVEFQKPAHVGYQFEIKADP
jgi:phage tail-like protein